MRKRKESHHAVEQLKEDHAKVKDLFDRFEEASASEKKQLAKQAIEELKVHAAIEEELFYPSLRRAGTNGIMDEADEEHHVAKLLIAELELMDGGEENFEAKFLVLAESVRHHIKEEEREMFPKAKKAGLDLDALGERMWELRSELKSAGVPRGPEDEVIGEAGLIRESPSRRAARGMVPPPQGTA